MYQIDNINSIDWGAWIPTEEATLCFIRKNGKILFIEKKTGMGKGLVNVPGGRIEPGETALEAAVRETREEVLLTPLNPIKLGDLYFQFVDGYKLRGHVFLSEDYEGIMGSTPEADPFWVDEDAIPFDRMWEDDRYWIPPMLEGIHVKGYFIFDKEEMKAFRIEG